MCALQWWLLFPFACLAVVVYVFGIPSIITCVLYCHRERIKAGDKAVKVRYGSQYAHLRLSYYLYEPLMLVKRMTFVIIVIFLSHFPGWQVLRATAPVAVAY